MTVTPEMQAESTWLKITPGTKKSDWGGSVDDLPLPSERGRPPTNHCWRNMGTGTPAKGVLTRSKTQVKTFRVRTPEDNQHKCFNSLT